MKKPSKISQQYWKWCGAGGELALQCIWKDHQANSCLPLPWSWDPVQELIHSWDCRFMSNCFTCTCWSWERGRSVAWTQHEHGNVLRWFAKVWWARASEVLHSQGHCEPNCLCSQFPAHRDCAGAWSLMSIGKKWTEQGEKDKCIVRIGLIWSQIKGT